MLETHDLLPGETVGGKYRVERKLGAGAMGAVYAATQLELARKVAIKVMLPSARVLPDADVRFLREARAAAALESEHAVKILDTGRLDDGTPYFVMERLDGEDLAQLLRRSGALPIAEAVAYVIDVCHAVGEAHARGIVHRDLKPSNVFLARRFDGTARVVVLDFGLAKDAGGLGTALDTTGGTAVLGSPMYMAPEQVRASKHVDARADVWAIGVLLQELLTARPVFHAETITALSAAIAADPPTPLRALRSDAPEELEAVILRCLEKDPARRVPDVQNLARALAPFAGPARPVTRSIVPSSPRVVHASQPPTSKPPDALGATVFASADASGAATKPSPGAPPPPPPSRAPMAIALGVLVAAGLGVGGWWLATHRPTTAAGVDAAPEASASAPPSAVVVAPPPPPDSGPEPPRCRADKHASVSVPGKLHFTYIAGGKVAALGVRATLPSDGGTREAVYLGAYLPGGVIDLHPPKYAGFDEGDVRIVAVGGHPSRYVFWRNNTPPSDRAGVMHVMGVTGDMSPSPGFTVARFPHESEDFAGAIRTPDEVAVVSVGKELSQGGPDAATTGHAVRAVVGVKSAVLRAGADLRAPAVAASPSGVVAAFRSARKVHLAWLNPDAEVDGAIADLGAGDVGAPALSLEGDVVHVVWAQRASNMEAYRLQYATWRRGDPKPSDPQPLDTGRAAAFAPTVIARAREIALGWMEEEGGRATVHFGVGATPAAAAAIAGELSTGRDPELALVGGQYVASWMQSTHGKDEVHVADVVCP